MKNISEFFRLNYNALSEEQRRRVEQVKNHAQAIVDLLAEDYEQMSEEGRSKAYNGTMFLETSLSWIVRAISCVGESHAAK